MEVKNSGPFRVCFYMAFVKEMYSISEAEEKVEDELKSSEYVWEEVVRAVNADQSLMSRLKMMHAGSNAIQLLSSAATLGTLI